MNEGYCACPRCQPLTKEQHRYVEALCRCLGNRLGQGPCVVCRPGRFERLGKGTRCVYCNGRATTLDHLLPLSRGGTNTTANLAPACYRCNQEKGSLTEAEYRRVRHLA